MSLLADFFLSPDDADAVRYEEEPASFADRLQLKSLTELELSTLWAILQGVEWDESMLDHFASVFEQQAKDSTIQRLPDALLTDLIALSPADTPAVASKWAATDELACKAEDVLPVIQDLRALASKASGTQQHVYFWNCL